MNVRPATAARPDPWVLRPVPDDAPAVLFCFPYSGCGASMYRAWPRSTGGVEIVPLQLPGRENRFREPHYGTYERLAAQLVAGIAPYLDRPYGLFGHCGGALPAFEAAVQIIDAGLPAPRRVLVSSQVAPQDGPYGRFLGMTGSELQRELAGLYRDVNGAEPMPELVEMLLEVLLEDVAANRRYHRPAGVLGCPITAIGWRQDVEIPPGLMGGWRLWGTVRDVLLDGDHHAFIEAPAALLAEVRADLLEG